MAVCCTLGKLLLLYTTSLSCQKNGAVVTTHGRSPEKLGKHLDWHKYMSKEAWGLCEVRCREVFCSEIICWYSHHQNIFKYNPEQLLLNYFLKLVRQWLLWDIGGTYSFNVCVAMHECVYIVRVSIHPISG